MENEILTCQTEYYDTIAASNTAGESTLFVQFIMERILAALEAFASDPGGKADVPRGAMQRLVHVMEHGRAYTAAELQSLLGLGTRDALRKRYLRPAIEAGLVVMSCPEKPTSRNQTYILAQR